MDKYLIANKFLSEGYSEEYMQESIASIIPDIALSMVLGAMSIGAYRTALSIDGDNLAKKISAKIEALKGKPAEKLNPMQRMRIKLSKVLEHSSDVLKHTFTEVIKTGDTKKAAISLGKRLKLDDEELKSLETYLTAIVYKIKTTKPLTDA